MDGIAKRFFGSEELARELQELDEDLKAAIKDIKKIKEDWHAKVIAVKEFIHDWNSNSGDLRNLIRYIRVVEGIESEESGIANRRKPILVIRRIINRIVEGTRDPTILRKLYNMLNSFFDNWKRLEDVLSRQMEFIESYSKEDIGVVYYHLPKFTEYLKEEAELLEIETKTVPRIISSENFARKLIRKRIALQDRRNAEQIVKRQEKELIVFSDVHVAASWDDMAEHVKDKTRFLNPNQILRELVEITNATTDLEILEIIPIQVVRDVDMVLGKTGLVRVNVKNNGPADSNTTVSVIFEGSNLTTYSDTAKKFILANQNASFDFMFKPNATGTRTFSASVVVG